MFIDSRVGYKDRLLTIQKINTGPDTKNGILFYGTETPLFPFAPCAFTMIINDFYFMNASSDNLLLPRLGFPSVTSPKLLDTLTGKYIADTIPGKNRIIKPIVQTYIPNAQSITFYQPIFKEYMKACPNQYTDSAYVTQHSYDITNGIGGIFAQRGNKAENIRYLNSDDHIGLHLKETPAPLIQLEGLKFQIAIGEKMLIPTPSTTQGLYQTKTALTVLQRCLQSKSK